MQSEFVRLHLFAGKFYEFAGTKGFPYEGKLSPEATDEVDCAS